MKKIRSYLAVLMYLSTMAIVLPATLAFSQNTAQKKEAPPPQDNGQAVIDVNPASKARIKIESDIYDFGSILKGTTVVHTYVIKSVGQDTLIVSKVRPTCGCTLAPLSSDHIAPGQEATVRAAFNTRKFNGRVEKYIFVDSNDPISPYLKVSFTAVINNPLATIQTDPLEADFGSIKSGANAEAKVHLTNADQKPMDLVIAEQSSADIKAKFLKAHLEPNSATDLVLDITPHSNGEIKESITIDSPTNDDARITIPITGTVTQ
jgi:hypothetical protein